VQQTRQQVAARFSRACLCDGNHIATLHGHRPGLRLDGRRVGEARLPDLFGQTTRQSYQSQAGNGGGMQSAPRPGYFTGFMVPKWESQPSPVVPPRERRARRRPFLLTAELYLGATGTG
jgi:hypothetical protein